MASLTDQLKSDGYKITVARKKIIDILSEAICPVSAIKLIDSIQANKTTIYRELNFLLEKQLVDEFDFGNGKKYYELRSKGHHHHLVCNDCKEIQCYDVKLDLGSEESLISNTNKFKVTSHTLDFYGLCARCK